MDADTRKPAAARAAIVASAAELIRVQGVAGTSISDVVAASGTSAGAIYHHFGNKQGLVMEVARRVIAGPVSLALSTAADGALSPADLFSAAVAHIAADEDTPALILQIWAGAKTDPKLFELLVAEASGVAETATALVSDWSDTHPPGIDDPDGLTAVLIGLVMGFAVQRALVPSWQPRAYLEVAAQLLATVEQ